MYSEGICFLALMMGVTPENNMLGVFLGNAWAHIKGNIYDSRAGCVGQMLLNDVDCSNQLSFVSPHMGIMFSFDNHHAEGTIIYRANKNLPIVIIDLS